MLTDYLVPAANAAGVIVLLVVLIAGRAIRYIPNDRIGVLEKKWSTGGSIPGGFIALAGEAGFQPDVLRGGYHFFMPFQFRVHIVPLVTITQGQIGYIFARDGAALPPTQTLASNAIADDFQDVRAFLAKGGQKGPQRKILREGTYAINTAQFIVLTADRTYAVKGIDADADVVGKKAPLVVQRFGDIKKLVEQTLDPMVSAYFKNIGQTKTLIQLLQERSDIQDKSSAEMKAKFTGYSLDLQEVLIGTPRAEPNQTGIEQILKQLRDRQVAVEQVETYKLQETAAVQERTLREKQAMADQQASITASSLAIQVKENEGKAQLAQMRQQAESIAVTAKANAERVRQEGVGEADRIRAVGLADAEKIRAVGLAQAEATDKQVQAYGGPQYQLNSQVLMRFAEAIEAGKMPIVPSIVVGGGNGTDKGASGGLVEMMLAMLVADKVGVTGKRPEG